MSAFNQTALDPARSVVVSACAGSGKTWLLVSRIVRALLDGAKPGEILDITFTRKAAREMQSRLTEWLKQMATADDATVENMLLEREMPRARVAALLPVARALYENVLTAEPPITITTFHSWFLQLLRRAPLDAGVAGDATLSEETAALIDEAWQRFATDAQDPLAAALDVLYADHGPAVTQRLLSSFLARRSDWWAYASDDNDELAITRALAALAEGMPAAPDEDVPAALAADASLKSQLLEFAKLLAQNTQRDQALADVLQKALGETNETRWLSGVQCAFYTTAGELRVRKASAAQAKRLKPQGETRYIAIHQSVGERLQAARQAINWQAGYRLNAAALCCGAALARTYQALKQERRVIDYTDIEWRAHQLVTASEHAVYLMVKLDARYRHVLLDEFQDTNPLQWLILKQWFDAAAEVDARPSVFVVGDPKQSIYRFRRAEARLFAQASEYLQQHFNAVPLAQDASRRCAPAVINGVNRVFGREAAFDDYRAHEAYHKVKPGRVDVLPLIEHDDAAEAEAVAWRNPLTTPLVVPEDSRRAREATVLAQGIRGMVGKGEEWWIAADDAGKVGRVARYGDIMILVRRRTHLATYEAALRHAGIPYVTSRQGGLLDTLEVQDLIALLEFLVSPFHNLKLAHALRSPVFAASDLDLVVIAKAVAHTSGATWWEALAAMPDDASGPALTRARRLLAAWLTRADMLPVHDQLDRIYFEADVLQRYHDAVPPAMRGAVAANLNAFMRRALDADAGRYLSLPRFVADLADLRNAPATESPDEGVIGDAGDAVRIHTVHGAKGLEAPIVWLPDAAASSVNSRAQDVLLDWPADSARPTHFSMCARKGELTPLQRSIAENEGDIARRENLNLLYVAMTRAQQVLIVSGIDGRGRENSWYEKMAAAVADEDLGGDELESEIYQQKQIVTSISPIGVDVDARLQQPLPTGTRRTNNDSDAMRHGTRFHVLMERLTEQLPPNIATLQRVLGIADAEFQTLAHDAQHIINEANYRRYFDATLYLCAANEAPLVTQHGELLRIDRLVEFADEVAVLDYKTGTLHNTNSALIDEYREQVHGYCVHIARAFPGKRVHGLILFTGGGSIEIAN